MNISTIDCCDSCETTAMVTIPFAVIIPKDQSCYQIMSTLEAETGRMMGVMAKTIDKTLKKGGL